jgi:hypothetical protein
MVRGRFERVLASQIEIEENSEFTSLSAAGAALLRQSQAGQRAFRLLRWQTEYMLCRVAAQQDQLTIRMLPAGRYW